jgi:PAS domain-containing protein
MYPDREPTPEAGRIRQHVRRQLLRLVAAGRGANSLKEIDRQPEPWQQRYGTAANLRLIDAQFAKILEALPIAVYTTDAAGWITFYNGAAAALWGRHPILGQDRWCGSWRIYGLDGEPIPHADCPMAIALREDRPVRNVAAVAERPDGTLVRFLPFPTPLHGAADRLIGGVNALVEIGSFHRRDIPAS